MQNKYFVYLEKKYYGPLQEDDIEALLKEGKITIADYIYDVNLKYVFMLGEHTYFKKFLPQKPDEKLLANKYIKIENNKLSAIYTKDSLFQAIFQRDVTPYDYFFLPDKNKIVQLKEIKKFEEVLFDPPLDSPTDEEGVCNTILIKKDASLQELVPEMARRFPRAPFSAATRIEHEGSVYIGDCSVIGEGGCFIELKNEVLKIGNILDITIISEIIHLEIKVQGEVTSVVKNYKHGIGVKFLNLKDNDKAKIREYVDRYIKQTYTKNS